MPRCPCLPCAHRWEVVARMHLSDGKSWIVPASEGRHFRASRLAAWWLARRWTRAAARRIDADSLAPQLRMTWEVRETSTRMILDLLNGPQEDHP